MNSILYHARVYPLSDPANEDSPLSAIAIINDRVAAVGSDEKILSEYTGSKMEKFDMGGKTVIPGLTDAHIHLEHYALGLQKINCETKTYAECLSRVEERASKLTPGEWILGHGWNQNEWLDLPLRSDGSGLYPVADALDAVAPHNPVFLTAKSLHAAWASRFALRKAGLNENSPDPAGGRIGRMATGSPDGILFESAMSLVWSILPEPGLEATVEAINAAQSDLWRMGLTGVHDFDRSQCFSALQILHTRHDLKLRVLKSIPLELLSHASELGLRSGFGDDFLRIGSVKAFADGALGPHTAAMLQPYEDDPDNRGMLLLDSEELFEQGMVAVRSGLSMAVHAIGDRANKEVLLAYGRLRQFEEEQHLSPLRHRIEHVQVLHPSDAGRLAELGVIASMQPIHAISDMVMADRCWGQRSELGYAWRTQLDHQAGLIFGSDAPVESPNPFEGVSAAVTRRRLDGYPSPEGWYPEQRLTVSEALRAYTIGPAYAAGMEDRLGSLSPGYLADLVVLDLDPFNCKPDQLHSMEARAVMVGGQWVWPEVDQLPW